MEDKKMNSSIITSVLYKNLRDFLSTKKRVPNIVDISIGDDFGSEMYAKMKKKRIEEETGIIFQSTHFDDIHIASLIDYIERLNEDPSIDGIMIQLPLPGVLAKYERVVLDLIDPKKDIDGLTTTSAGKLACGETTFKACTALGIETLLKSYDVKLDGSLVGIINRSGVVGKPLAQIMLSDNATPIICHSHTQDLASITSKCDIVVAALNKQEMITSDYIKDGAVVVDVGVHKNSEGKTVGDVLYDDVENKASLITPPVGTVGPMTICMLAYNATKSNYGTDVDKLLSEGVEEAKKLLKR